MVYKLREIKQANKKIINIEKKMFQVRFEQVIEELEKVKLRLINFGKK